MDLPRLPAGFARRRPHTHKDGRPKVRYDTMDEALAVAEELLHRDDLNGRLRNSMPCAYSCKDDDFPDCNGWHVGNYPKRGFAQSHALEL